MLVSGIPYKFATPWATDAASANINTPIPATSTGALASQQQGFPLITATPEGAGGVPPTFADFNGLEFYNTSWLQWLQAGGPVGYDAAFSTAIGGYPKDAMLNAASGTGQFWISTADNNTTDPDTGGAGWVSLASLAFPTGLGTLTTTQTLTNAAAGTYYNINTASLVITLNDGTFTAGQTIGFIARVATTINTGGSTFYGGSLSGSSLAMPAGSFVALEWDGVNWRQIAGSFLPPVTYNATAITTNTTLTSEYFGVLIETPTAGITLTMPPEASNVGQTIRIYNNSTGYITLAAGNFNSAYGSAVSTIPLPPGTTGEFVADTISWNGLGGSAAVGTPVQPTNVSGVGLWQACPTTGSGSNTYFTTPSGGTWAYMVSNSGAGVSGVAAGGYNVYGPFTPLNLISFCWRIT